ncbi:relA-associated inhibitor isoform X1 [Pundamilia nyererei]|uniref:Protein phosphatase 1 regulatory subunit 13 like n=1 Tax=Pundamilia nyererei TaxID=303518 RepID=A0A3B4FHV6_9CICH|nr:PREDICTED: relA-associated inhibitor isoform X1 [Pundamilia nyererei]XP_005735942.1 PREDICTED: relA-associated inhibitor isoform X1 [Pundamilia nyererei]
MSSQTSFGSSMLFQTMNDDLSASLATADELSKEFNSLLQEASTSNNNTESKSQATSSISREQPQSSWSSSTSTTKQASGGSSNGSPSSSAYSTSSASFRPIDSVSSNDNNTRSSPVFPPSPLSSPKLQRSAHAPVRAGSDIVHHSYSHSAQNTKYNSLPHYDKSPRSSVSSTDRSPAPNSKAVTLEPSASAHSNLLRPYDSSQMRPRSPRFDRSPSALSVNYPMSSTLPRNFSSSRQQDEAVQWQKSPGKWNETDLDMSYERKPHHTYDKTEWLRSTMPNPNWKESNLDGPSPAPSPIKDRLSNTQFSSGSLPRNARIAVPPSQSHSPYQSQPISRISIPPNSTQSRQHKPIPLSVIMRLQNPYWGAMIAPQPRVVGGQSDMSPYQPAVPVPKEFFQPPAVQPQLKPPELWQPALYSDVLNPADIDAELERLVSAQQNPVNLENPAISEGSVETEGTNQQPPRPLSPTTLQPVVAPDAQSHVTPVIEEVLRIRAEIPRALKRRGSVNLSKPLKKPSHYQPNQYKHLINKLFRKEYHNKADKGSESSSSSDGEDSALPPPPPPKTPTLIKNDKNYRSILRLPNRKRKNSGRRARLSPLVLVLDGALAGDLDTVQKAVQEMSDPSQPNEEGITALHNAVCFRHHDIVDFLVRIGVNVSAPDSHGWTPLHCAASCNDRPLCEFLVRSGAAVMAVTERDRATASQKCDPYAPGYEECETFLRAAEEAMGVDNSGVLYALWSYPAQAADELSFKDGDMVTILQKPEGSDWWWASLCGREGFVPNNYFGLFPKVRPKSLC